MAKIDWIEQRLQNWARWKLTGGAGVLGFAAVNLENADMPREPYADAPIPTSNVEAGETDDAVQRLPGELKATVLEAYLGVGTMRQKLERLHCSATTMHERIGRAHRLLADHFLAKQDRAKAERARVEALRDAQRPRGEGVLHRV